MVATSYMEGRAAPPSPMKVFLDRNLMPLAIDAAGAVEAQLERIAVQARRAPLRGLAVACLVGITFASLVRGRRR